MISAVVPWIMQSERGIQIALIILFLMFFVLLILWFRVQKKYNGGVF